MDGLFVGLISGTSMDGVDAALVRFNDRPILLHALCLPYPEPLRQRILQVADPATLVSVRELGQLDVQIGRHFADAAEALLQAAKADRRQVVAIGSHGQTVGHYPEDEFPSTLQIGDPNVIAENTGIVTVADLRRRDLAVGGQGAPLVPAFHRAVLQTQDETRVVVNIGGMANITVLHAHGGPAPAFDTGPGNALLDAWSQTHLHQPLDENGRWSATGRVLDDLLGALLADPYFQRPPPKSTGREYFNRSWLERALEQTGLRDAQPRDVQATLCQLTAQTIVDAARAQAPDAARLIVCGGGAHNRDLMDRLATAMSPQSVVSSAEYGIDPDWMEAMAFAWLAARRLSGAPGNLPAATGARKAVPLGAIYPGGITP